jgi:hypothetical protein
MAGVNRGVLLKDFGEAGHARPAESGYSVRSVGTGATQWRRRPPGTHRRLARPGYPASPVGGSKTSRTFRASIPEVNGFCRNAISCAFTP